MDAVDRYILSDLVAMGVYGKVWNAYDTVEHRDVVVKVHPIHEPERRERAEQELAALRALSIPSGPCHKHLVCLLDYWEDQDPEFPTAYFVLEKVYGERLLDMSTQAVSPEKAWFILGELLEAVTEMNMLGYQHGDLHGNNVLWTGTNVVIIDLGTAIYRGPVIDKYYAEDWKKISGTLERLFNTKGNRGHPLVRKYLRWKQSIGKVPVRKLADLYLEFSDVE